MSTVRAVAMLLVFRRTMFRTEFIDIFMTYPLAISYILRVRLS